MHLVFIIDNPPIIGGGDYALYKYAEAMARRGHDVDVFGCVFNEFMDGLERRPNFRVRLRGELPPFIRGVGRLNRVWNRIYTKAWLHPWVRRRSRKPDFIVGYHRQSALKSVALGMELDIPVANVVFETPDWLSRTLGERFDRFYQGRFRAQWEAVREAYRASALLLPLSELVRQEVAAWTGRPVEPPLYCGIDVGALSGPSTTSGDGPVVYIGRLDANKNVHELIDAVSRLPSSPPICIAGSGHDEAELRALARQRGVACQFMGRVSDKEKWALLRRARFMVFPTSFEGFGIPPAEMLACGRPCVCSDIPILREVYGDHVEYFPEHDVGALTQAMQRLLDDEPYAQQRGRVGRQFVLETYTWDRCAVRMEASLSSRKKGTT